MKNFPWNPQNFPRDRERTDGLDSKMVKLEKHRIPIRVASLEGFGSFFKSSPTNKKRKEE
ncbi:MAG: hypothetical protein IJ345_08915 [Clostridia bacterium]|nr:hypothetical protein [Clostridia bacterium]